MKGGIRLPLIARAESHAGRTAIVDTAGTHAHSDLLDASARVAAALLEGRDDLRKERVAFLVAPSFAWVAVQWGIWRAAGGVAVADPPSSGCRLALCAASAPYRAVRMLGYSFGRSGLRWSTS